MHTHHQKKPPLRLSKLSGCFPDLYPTALAEPAKREALAGHPPLGDPKAQLSSPL